MRAIRTFWTGWRLKARPGMPDYSADIDAYFQAYAKAFSAFDTRAVTRLWHFPAFISTSGHSVAFDNPAAFEANTEALCRFYKAQGMVRAEKSLLTVTPLYDGVVLARTADRLMGMDGSLIADWEHCYLLRRMQAGWRAVAAVADGELAALGRPRHAAEPDRLITLRRATPGIRCRSPFRPGQLDSIPGN